MTACDADIRALLDSECTIEQYAQEWERLLAVYGPVALTVAVNKYAPAHQDSARPMSGETPT